MVVFVQVSLNRKLSDPASLFLLMNRRPMSEGRKIRKKIQWSNDFLTYGRFSLAHLLALGTLVEHARQNQVVIGSSLARCRDRNLLL